MFICRGPPVIEDDQDRDRAFFALPRLFPALLSVVLRSRHDVRILNPPDAVMVWAFDPTGVVPPYVEKPDNPG
ncbi:hypothetical protein SISSUDRAFT_1053641 [Sistotremastrum suecicum HHB10207 ss-3]|uniref:Uncharacterized protein n=1 Tax=Sistotremastrum suecicum HHB10207 ss-3 TaxID=1314776 RepID=A0A165Z363_9AGAM|nr:hypothetical protein SISSUDRAFT_1053641 [Sistotremastrum suecicum HHB10207 ss-3]